MKKIYKYWKAMTQKIGNFQTSLIFSMLYFLVFTPLGLLASRFKDFLGIHSFPVWEKIETQKQHLTDLEKQ